MEFNQIEAFVAISQEQSFSRAALKLYMSQPAISRRITLLEQELGALLFERVHAGAILTLAGEKFLPYARQILAAMRDGVAVVQAHREAEQGLVKLAIVGTLASTDLTTRLLTFRKHYPDVQVRLQTARSREVSSLVQSGEVHLGLRYFSDADTELVAQVVHHEALVVVCAGHHHLASAATLAPEHLQSQAWVGFPIGQKSSGEPFANWISQQLEAAGLAGEEMIAIDSLTAQKRLIEAGFGLGMLPISSVQEELRSGTLCILDVPQLQTTVPVMVLYRADGYLSKAAQTLLDMLVKNDEDSA